MTEETTVEKAWRLLLEGGPSARRGNAAVIEAAYAEPRLRVLFPFLSHGCLTFHRNSQFPWSGGLPFIAGGAPCTVYAPSYSSVLGKGLMPEKAAALVVANLPLDCGPAFDRPWPPPDSHAD
ncbi:DUF6193 family natural product biosynthesis protein [Streptomyces sp. NBC_01754]|uniref:DUF6193 family natural product biosynthesis protein n=1 Tax=Streptomyces sp. NBC_01754 TaxID=2975930 RepID=UPI002DD97069|nr:DUF6193 family natural product biosynthesis protein [Streptomyces sp. NBC_01754]WSC91356.1 DUF6193 family natural product biosynthesis protein [Streptomyces sp. NBC_01754]